MSKPFFSGRIPQDLLDAVEAHCSETGESKTDVLINALSNYLKHPTKTTPIEDRLSLLEDRVAALEKKQNRKTGIHQLPIEGINCGQTSKQNSGKN